MFKTIARTIALVTVMTLVSTSVAYAGYPNPLPDFAHPGSPHQPLFSPKGGDLDRPMLVIFEKFTDVAHQNFSSTAGDLAGRFFGAFPSVRDYFLAASFSKLVLSAAAETDASNTGAANDGVVSVSINMTQTAFDGQAAADQNAQALQAADASVNFAAFDTNQDGKITNEELIVVQVKTAPTNQCGANFGVSALTLDGKSIALAKMAIVGQDTNVMTYAHEVAHQAIEMRDLYGFGVGTLDIAGPTCSSGDVGSLREPNAWQKLHWGWIVPTIVTSDGYYNVSRYETTGASFLLYDPNKNTDNYFLVENRVRQGGSYDQNISDEGLVIWRVDDAQYGSVTDSVRPVEIMRPDGTATPGGQPCGQSTCFYAGNSTDAWNPSDSGTPQRTMIRNWRDGTASHVAVRAIPDRSDVMRVYFDVPGPGILVDTYDRMKQGPIFVPLGDTANVTFPVTNTGDSTDAFAFTVTVPVGFTATTEMQSLVASGGGTAHVDVTPSLNVATGQYLMNATGHSINDPNVTSSSPVSIWVIRRESTVTYIGDLAADYHDSATLSAKLTDTETGDPIAGGTITFTLGAQQVTAVTDAFGIANTSLVLTQAPGVATVKTDFAGDATYFPSNDGDTFTITREETTTTYTGPTVILQGASGVTLQARLLEDGTTAPDPSGQTLTLTLGAQSCNAIADNTGLASCSFIYSGALGPQPIGAAFAGDIYYEPSSDTGKTALVFAFPSSGAFLLGDDTVATAGPTTTVTWWDSSWSSLVELSGGDSPPAFKGYASTVVTLPTTTPPASCSGTWSTTSGSSAPPTSGVPSYMGVLVTPSVGKSGSTINGTYAGIVIVATDAGYAPSSGHSGTGHIVATFC